VHRRRLGRPRGEDHRADVEARGARRLDREQGMVDGPQPGPRGDHYRPAEVEREVADRVAEGERDEQPADALRDHHLGAYGARGRHERGRVDRRPRQLGREVRRHRRAEALRRDLRRGPPRRGGEQLVVRRPGGWG